MPCLPCSLRTPTPSVHADPAAGGCCNTGSEPRGRRCPGARAPIRYSPCMRYRGVREQQPGRAACSPHQPLAPDPSPEAEL